MAKESAGGAVQQVNQAPSTLLFFFSSKVLQQDTLVLREIKRWSGMMIHLLEVKCLSDISGGVMLVWIAHSCTTFLSACV